MDEDEIRYAVYVVIVEDTPEAFDALMAQVPGWDSAGSYDSYEEAEDVMTTISKEPRIAARAAQEARINA